jgi:hypothetical protein
MAFNFLNFLQLTCRRQERRNNSLDTRSNWDPYNFFLFTKYYYDV